MRALITDEERAQMLANGERSSADETHDPRPVVKLFIPGRATWLLSDLDPDDGDLAFGLCDLRDGHPMLGTVRLSALADLAETRGLIVERDENFAPVLALSDYAREAFALGSIKA